MGSVQPLARHEQSGMFPLAGAGTRQLPPTRPAGSQPAGQQRRSINSLRLLHQEQAAAAN